MIYVEISMSKSAPLLRFVAKPWSLKKNRDFYMSKTVDFGAYKAFSPNAFLYEEFWHSDKLVCCFVEKKLTDFI